MKRLLFGVAAALAVLLYFNPDSGAEEIKNFSGCEVCPGNIWFGPEETRKILGEKGFSLVSEIEKRTAKKNLCRSGGNSRAGNRKRGPRRIRTENFAFSEHALYRACGGPVLYSACHGQSGKQLRPMASRNVSSVRVLRKNQKLDEPLEFAWAKMKKSMIWKWAATEDAGTQANSLSSERIIQALEILAGEK